MEVGGRRFEIEVFGLTMVMHGCIESRRRLTDLANDAEPFLAMSDIESYPYPGDELVGVGGRTRGLISKESIVMLAEHDVGMPASANADMRVAKMRSPILVYTDNFAISANIHLPVNADIEHFLAVSPGRFVPVTDATATPIHQGTKLFRFERPFMLLNRDHIAFVGTPEAVPAVAAPAVETRIA